jgi:hypothetical protein
MPPNLAITNFSHKRLTDAELSSGDLVRHRALAGTYLLYLGSSQFALSVMLTSRYTLWMGFRTMPASR